jgi:predicted ATPase
MLAIVQDRFSEVTKSVVRIGPHRERPDRVTFVNPNEKSTFVGTQGENVMSIINQSTDSEIEVLNEWIEKLGIPYKITRNFIEEFNISLAILTDEEGMSVSLADVGYGISQVLPIVLESILRQNTIIAIEQPELHLHPKLQANLADLFIKSAEICNNNFILETHSEHIILRLKRRQKEAREDFVMTELDYKKSKSHKNNSNNAKIENQRNKGLETWVSIRDSVVITVIDTPKNKSESEFSRITLNSDGDFDSLWPGDFFPERYKELGLEDDF